MILFPELKAVVRCEEKDCPTAVVGVVLLTNSGTLGVGTQDWQMLQGEDGIFHTFCPEHRRKLEAAPIVIPAGAQIGPRGLRPMNGHGGHGKAR